jgi:nucleoside-diphosphate-sugar epimerase
VPWIIQELRSNKAEINLTEGKQRRDFIYISDAIEAIFLILKNCGDINEYKEYDIASGELITIKEFVELILNIYKKKNVKCATNLNFGAVPYRPGEIMCPKADLTSIFEMGWAPFVGHVEGIKRIIDWSNE